MKLQVPVSPKKEVGLPKQSQRSDPRFLLQTFLEKEGINATPKLDGCFNCVFLADLMPVLEVLVDLSALDR